MLDHIGFPVTDFARSKAFYTRVLEPLGFKLIMEVNLSEDGEDGYAGFGPDRPHFWIGTGKPLNGTVACGIRRQKPCRGAGVLRGGTGGRWHRQRGAGAAAALSRELLRGLRPRPRRPQHRGRQTHLLGRADEALPAALVAQDMAAKRKAISRQREADRRPPCQSKKTGGAFRCHRS